MFDLIPFGRNERNLFNYLDNVERSFWDGSISNMAQFRCDVQDKGDSYLLEAELPGFEREDIGIDLDGTTLVITARHSSESGEKDKDGNYLRRERKFGSFSRSFDVSGVDTEHISAAYKNGGLELTLPAGCIMGLIGENGAGKSTTIRLILNSLGRDGGTVAGYGKDNRTLTALEQEDIGVVLDEVGLPEYMNAAQIGRMLAGIFRRWQPEVYEEYLHRLELPEDKAFKDYSRGMRMKLGLAAALSHQPRLLLLDEATSGLDPVVRDDILTIFADFTRDEDHAVLISSHIVSDLEKICDYIAFLHRGRLLLCEEKDRLTEEYGILRGEAEGLDPAAVCGRRNTPYGTEYLVRRGAVPAGLALGQVNIEDLFVFMAKEA